MRCGVLPTDIEPFVQVAAIGRVGILPEEGRVSFEVRALVDIKRDFRVEWELKEGLTGGECARYHGRIDGVVLDCQSGVLIGSTKAANPKELYHRRSQR